MKYHTLFLSKIGKDVANLSSAAVVIGAFRVNIPKYPVADPEGDQREEEKQSYTLFIINSVA